MGKKTQSNERGALFFDLLATRAYAEESPERFHERLTAFHEIVWDVSREAKHSRDLEVTFFSDSVFAQTRDLVSAVEFARDVRASLLAEGLFVRGSVGVGDLGIVEAKIKGEQEAAGWKGYRLGVQAANLYSSQQSLKGSAMLLAVGKDEREQLAMRVDSTSGESLFCQSAYVDPSRGATRDFYDLSLPLYVLTDRVFDGVIAAIYRTKLRDPGIAQYYIPVLVTWAQSLKVPRLAVDLYSERKAPLTSSLLSGRLEQAFEGFSGFHVVFFSILQRLMESLNLPVTPLPDWKAILQRLVSMKWVAPMMRDVPVGIFSAESQRRYSEFLASTSEVPPAMIAAK